MTMRRMCSALGMTLVMVVLVSLPGCKKEASPAAQAGQPVNTICPIMKAPVSSSAPRREFRGQTVGFCCAQCPPEWDKLTDDEKKARLDAAMGRQSPLAPTTMTAGMSHEGHVHPLEL